MARLNYPDKDSGADSLFQSNNVENKMRSESTEYETARRDRDKAAREPSLIGRAVWPEEMQLRDAARRPYTEKMNRTGGYD